MVDQQTFTPNLTQLRKQAKDLSRAVRSGDPDAIQRVRRHHPAPPTSFASFALRDAQLTLAREKGYESWHEMNTAVGEQMIEEHDLHRWFGVSLNNEVWSRIDDGEIGPESPLEERESLLYSAYASALHWRKAGTVANTARGEHLISRAASAVGMPEIALHHANRCLDLVEANPGSTEDWDLAFALEALARAEAGAGDPDRAADTLRRARRATEVVAGSEDRAIVEGELRRGPWFGLT